MAGPLEGIRIVELAGIGPAPFAAMMLADHGAEVVRVERSGMIGFAGDPLRRSRRSIALDLRKEGARRVVRRLAARADGLVEGYRPGVMERLGIGPEELMPLNPALIYGRVTGWGQEGPLSQRAGHDIDYLALTGLLHGIGPKERPVVPVNYLADFAGGGMMLAFGMVAALLSARQSGKGQVIDCAMTDGAALIGALTYGLKGAGMWRDERESNLLDGGDPNYGLYACADGKYLAVGAIEPQFRKALADMLGIEPDFDRPRLERIFLGKTRDEWAALFESADACVAPVLDLSEAPLHPHNADRGTFVELDGLVQPGPAPRYSATRCDRPRPPDPGSEGEAILAELGYSPAEIAGLREEGALY